MATVLFRKCDLNDSQDCQSLHILFEQYMLDPMGDADTLEINQQEKLIEELAKRPYASIFFVLLDNKIAGFSTLFELFSTFKVMPYLYIHDFVIDKSCRGKGLGKIFMEFIVNLAKEKGCCKIALEVREDNAAAKLIYAKAGFVECEPSMHFWTKKLD